MIAGDLRRGLGQDRFVLMLGNRHCLRLSRRQRKNLSCLNGCQRDLGWVWGLAHLKPAHQRQMKTQHAEAKNKELQSE